MKFLRNLFRRKRKPEIEPFTDSEYLRFLKGLNQAEKRGAKRAAEFVKRHQAPQP